MDKPDLPTPAITESPLKGRGSSRNIPHRFSTETRERESDGWDSEPRSAPRTELQVDRARSIISRNDSPDIEFDSALNPYRGCEHGCIYCYARPTHAWLGLSPGLDFETKIIYKPDAVTLLREALSNPDYRCSPLALGSATDAYQPAERQLQLTRRILEVLYETRHPLSIVTKAALIERDIDLLSSLAKDRLAYVGISLTTLDSALARTLEPRASAPQARLKTIEKLAAAGIPVRLFISPLIPTLTDQEMEKLLQAGQERGASSATYTLLRLPHEVAELFREWLACHSPEKAGRLMAVLYDLHGGKVYDSRFEQRMTGLGHFASLIRQRFELACRRLGLSDSVPALDCTRFRPPRVNNAQGELF